MVWVLDVAVKHVALVIAHKAELEFFVLNSVTLFFSFLDPTNINFHDKITIKQNIEGSTKIS